MNTWLALTKKEFKLGLPAFFVIWILFISVIATAFFTGSNLGYTDEILVTLSLFISSLHVFALTFYLFYSLNTERKRLHLWLHNPMSVYGLLSAKLFTSFIFMVTTFIISIVINLIFIPRVTDLFDIQTVLLMLGTMSAILIFSSLFIATIFLLFWSIFMVLSQNKNTFLTALFTVIMFFVIATIYGKIMDLSFIQTLTQWGEIQFRDIFVRVEFNYELDGESISSNELGKESILYIGNYVRDAIVMVIMFLASCWIIERKVEV